MIDHDNLEEFSDPEGYDVEDSSDTGVAFYAGLARETGGPVLELACGTGRVSIPIARLGIAVTGVDIVPGMVEVARRKAAGLPARWVAADARSFDATREKEEAWPPLRDRQGHDVQVTSRAVATS